MYFHPHFKRRHVQHVTQLDCNITSCTIAVTPSALITLIPLSHLLTNRRGVYRATDRLLL